MIDVTEMVQRYRLTLRHIWNSGVWVDPELRRWESVDSFQELKLPLFRMLVADRLGFEAEKIFGEQFRIGPDTVDGDGIPALQVNTRPPSSVGGGVWKPMLGPFTAADVDLVLLDFFDWSPMNFIDLRFYRVLVESCRSHPEAIGHHALVDVAYARVFWTPPTKLGADTNTA